MAIKDLTGEKFFNWKVISRGENIGSKPAWICECQCDKKNSEDKKVNEIKVNDFQDFQCKSLANFYPEPKKEETFKNLKMEQCQDMSDMSEKLDAEKQNF